MVLPGGGRHDRLGVVKPLALLVLASVLAAPAARAQDITVRENPRDLERRRAILQGLDYLAEVQNRDGSFGDIRKGGVGISALCLLAFMAQGHQEGRGRYASGDRDVLRKGVNFLLSCSLAPRDAQHPLVSGVKGYPVGYIYREEDADSRMHGHGYATQVLVLAYGQAVPDSERARELKEKIRRAVWVIDQSQTTTGGWGYEPRHSTTHEGSVTVTVVQALRLAAGAGFVVDKETHRRGLAYLRESQKDDGSFKYSTMSDHSSAALTAAALTAMHGFGEYYSESVDRGLRYLKDRYRFPDRVQWPFYGHYYAAQAFYRAGDEDWAFWNARCVPHILGQRNIAGYWDDNDLQMRRGSHGRAYATSLAVLALSVPDGYLPLFQR